MSSMRNFRKPGYLKPVLTKADIKKIEKFVRKDWSLERISAQFKLNLHEVRKAYRRNKMAVQRPTYCYERDIYLGLEFSFLD